MAPTVVELLESAKALPLEERAELAQELLASLGTHDVRPEAMRAAVAEGLASLDAGEGIEISAGVLREYLRERGRLATERVNAKLV